MPKTFYNDEVDRVEYAEDVEEIEDAELPAEDAISEEKKILILRLMKANGAIEGIRSTLRVALGNVSPEKRKAFEEHLSADELVERFIPVYAKYFTEEELKALIRFYGSPAGIRNLEVSPKIMEESLKVSIEYFKTVSDGVKPKS